ncbi:Hypothetical predicted protein [Marmota monax]|uniref:Peptidase M14 domain-containing protein n=1 Tax=Marmota monax TaxID=9995 RepID=A0A5E4BKL5_MARMO|nr:Hypothetical predicted protein [Marmota monax]
MEEEWTQQPANSNMSPLPGKSSISRKSSQSRLNERPDPVEEPPELSRTMQNPEGPSGLNWFSGEGWPREAARLAPRDRAIYSVNRSFSPQPSPAALPAFTRVKGMTHVTASSVDSFEDNSPASQDGGSAPSSSSSQSGGSTRVSALTLTVKKDQVFRINVRNGDEVSKLTQLVNSDNFKLNFWSSPSTLGRPVDVLVPSISLQPVKSFLKSQGLEYSVTIDDLQALLDNEDEEMQYNEGQERSNNTFNYGAYHTLEAIYQEMDNIATDFPDLASRVKIGQSFENRPMYVLKFSTGGEQRPAIWLNAGIHSREWISQATAIWMARKIVSDYGEDPAVTSILEKVDIFLLPVANPDGYVYTHTQNRLWRKTRSLNPGSRCVGTDPNRNWNASFAGEGASDNPCSEVYHGPHANSEVEVKSVVDFIQKHGNFRCFIDLHSYSQLLMYPYGYTVKKAPDAEELDDVARHAAAALASLSGTKYQVGPTCTTVYPASGSSIDWAYDNGIKYAFTFELRDTGHYGFLLPANQIIPTAEETWLGLKTIMEHVRDNLY